MFNFNKTTIIIYYYYVFSKLFECHKLYKYTFP